MKTTTYLIIAMLLVAIGGQNTLAYSRSSNKITPEKVFDAVNKERVKIGLPALKRNSTLDQAAQNKVNDMTDSTPYWAHVSPERIKSSDYDKGCNCDIPQQFKAVGYEYVHGLENLAKEYPTVKGVVTGWLNSTMGHRENLYNSYVTETGIAVKDGVVVQVFGSPKLK